MEELAFRVMWVLGTNLTLPWGPYLLLTGLILSFFASIAVRRWGKISASAYYISIVLLMLLPIVAVIQPLGPPPTNVVERVIEMSSLLGFSIGSFSVGWVLGWGLAALSLTGLSSSGARQ
jgi:hypothetical protein